MQRLAANSVDRFTDRVADYARYRPGYPPTVLEFLKKEAHLMPATVVADVGCGPGMSSVPFLQNGNEVYGVEPNEAMRRAAETLVVQYPRFHVVAGVAEQTTLPDQSIDLVVAGQAFHWFNLERTKTEFRRILHPAGQVAILWNTFRTDATPFMRDYEALLREFGTDYEKVHHKNVSDQTLAKFFAPAVCRYAKLDNEQVVDFDGLRGRLLSSSYVPAADHPRRQPMLDALTTLFARHDENGQVRLEYDAEVYVGQLKVSSGS